MAGEVFCWKLLIQKLKLTQVARDYYRNKYDETPSVN